MKVKLKKELVEYIESIIASAREKAIRSVDTERVLMMPLLLFKGI